MKTKNKITLIITFIAIITVNGIAGELFSKEEQKFPQWILKLIEKEEYRRVANPPASLNECKYKGKKVYYLPPRCCDIPSSLYDENGNFVCSPDGGKTGNGDGKCTDFFYEFEKSECVVIWQDKRTRMLV